MQTTSIKFNTLIRKSDEDKPTDIINEKDLYAEFMNTKNRVGIHGYAEMINYVKARIFDILSLAVNRRAISLQIITDIDFLTALNNCAIILSKEYVNKFNRIYRSYIINPEKNVIYNDNCANIMYIIALRFNKQLTDIFKSIGLQEADALWLAVNRNSSTDERRNIRNLTRAIQSMNPKIMTEQMIVDIYSKTFNNQLTNLFCSIMTDRYDTFNSDDEKYVYSTVSNALLDILNTMDIEEIKDILIEYESELHKSGVGYRFSMQTINSGDYKAICGAIDELYDMGITID